MDSVKVFIRGGNSVRLANGLVALEYDTARGTYDFIAAERKVISGAYCCFKLSDDLMLDSTGYAIHEYSETGMEAINDSLGKGIRIRIVHRSTGKPDLRQTFTLYEGRTYFLTEVEIIALTDISTNYIAPLVLNNETSGGDIPDIGLVSDERFLFVPFDNDCFIRYKSVPIHEAGASCEVTAVFDNVSRRGLVMGSVTHDTWKTGISASAGGKNGRLSRFCVYSGAADEFTRDSAPHGKVSGRVVKSSVIFVVMFEDYRKGLETYGKVNSAITPALKWEGGVPFGWNSWAAVGDKLSLDVYITASDFFKQNIQDLGCNGNGFIYINFDSFWTNLSADEIAEAVRHVNKNGQKAGFYWSPFTYWAGDNEAVVEGTYGLYKYRDILLRDSCGTPVPVPDGGAAIDPTHPGAILRIRWMLDNVVQNGFEYIKLDFMNYGILEGQHYDPGISTGVQAYNFGMKLIAEILSPERVGRPFFINLSIAPLFPFQYAHSRRVSCDAFGPLEDTEYMLNSLTYGWWMNNSIYRFNDPDHVVLYESFNKPAVSENEALSRFNASVIAGTVLIDSDDLRKGEARIRASRYLTNPEVNNLAMKGKSFVPVEGNTGEGASDVFVLDDRGENALYIAVFNYNSKESTIKSIRLERLGLDPEAGFKTYDLWSKASSTAKGLLLLNLEPAQSVLLKLTPQ